MIIEKIEESGSLFQAFVSFLHEEKKEFDVESLRARCNKIVVYGEAYCVKHGEDMVSYLCFYANDMESATAFITAIKTSPRYRGQGYAKALTMYCFSVMKSRGMKRCLLEVREDNETAIRFYEKIGFVKNGGISSREGYLVMEVVF